MVTLQQLLGIELPIIQAPMAGVQGSRLAVCASNAGGLGSLPGAMLSLAQLRDELEAIKNQTQRPYNVNFFCHKQPDIDLRPAQTRDAAWRQTLAPYYAELGLDATQNVAGPARTPFNQATCSLLAQFKPAVVSFHFGLPEPALLAQVKAWGAKVLSTATTADEARWLARNGVDAVIAQGIEAGGHRGHFLSTDLSLQMGTFALLTELVGAAWVPVIAAGGIADASMVAAALAQGAAGVQVGTAYLLCPEASTSTVHRAAVASLGATETALTNLFSGRPARGIVNRLMRELGGLSALPPEFPLASAALAPLRSHAEAAGSGDFSPLWAGQNASACRVMSAADLTRQLAGLRIKSAAQSLAA
jgi:nitronate monooxygenase